MRVDDTVTIPAGTKIHLSHQPVMFEIPHDIEVQIGDIISDNYGRGICFQLDCDVDPSHLYKESKMAIPGEKKDEEYTDECKRRAGEIVDSLTSLRVFMTEAGDEVRAMDLDEAIGYVNAAVEEV